MARRRQRLCVTLGLCLWMGCAAAQGLTDLPSESAWRSSRARQAGLIERRAALREAAADAARLRGEARLAGDGPRERALLSRGEALADSIEQLTIALLAEELRSAPLAERLAEEIGLAAAQAGALDPDAGSARLSGLRSLEAEVRAAQPVVARGEFSLPRAGEEDPPEILRQKAAYARDLIDRAGRWLDAVAQAEARLARARLAQDAEQLLADQAFFDPQTGLFPDRAADEERGAAPGTFEGLLAQVAGGLREARSARDAGELLALLRGFLQTQRLELERRASDLEREAERREREG